MQTQAKTEALLAAIESRLNEISVRQHALAVERARLNEQITPLRLGIISPDVALALLKAKGVTLRLPAAPRRSASPHLSPGRERNVADAGGCKEGDLAHRRRP